MSNPIKAGVIGHPIAHSKSPLIHGTWIKAYGLDGNYTAIDIPPDNLEHKINALREAGFAGFNVTVPHKLALLSLCDTVDVLARQIGAVNTVTLKNGKFFGTNTDVFGFLENIRAHAPAFDFTAGPALVLGAGGAARAVVHALLSCGTPHIFLCNRSADKAQSLRDTAVSPERITMLPWSERDSSHILKRLHLLVNTTALGMTGKEALNLNLTALPQACLVHDIVYAPLNTDLLQAAMARGNPIVTGIGMLLHQARPAFQEWFGIMPRITPELETLVLRNNAS